MNNSRDEQTSARVIDEAAEWLARLHSNTFSELEKNALDQWLQQDAEHQRVWQRAELLAGQFGSISPQLGMSVLGRERGRASRRKLVRNIAALLLLPSASWLGVDFFQTSRPNFYRTAVGERREIILADSSKVALNTASKLNVIFDASQRLLEHIAGEVFIKTASDAHFPHRQFLVETENGRMRALGTEFVVRQSDKGTHLSVLEGAVEVITGSGQSSVIVNAGQRVQFNMMSIEPAMPIQVGVDAWRNGVLYARAMRLADFALELARYRPGLLRCDPAVADLKVTGAFRLANTDTILRLLEDTLPVTVDARTRYWVTINPR